MIPQAGASNETGNSDNQDSGLPNKNEGNIGLTYVSLEKLSATGHVYYPPDLNSLCYSSRVRPAYDDDYFSQYWTSLSLGNDKVAQCIESVQNVLCQESKQLRNHEYWASLDKEMKSHNLEQHAYKAVAETYRKLPDLSLYAAQFDYMYNYKIIPRD